MDRKPWRRLVSKGKPVRFDSATGVLDLHECSLASSTPSILSCSVAGRPSLALAKLTENTVHGKIGGRLSEDVTFTCDRGDVFVIGMLVGPPGVSESPSLQTETAAVASKKQRIEPKAEAPQKKQKTEPTAAAPKKRSNDSLPTVVPTRAKVASGVPVAEVPEKPTRPKIVREPKPDRPEATAAHAVAAEKALAAAALLRAAAPRQRAEEPAGGAAASGTTLAAELKDAEPLAQRLLKSGLRYEVMEAGEGSLALPSKAVRINFEGRVAATGEAFDSGTLDFRLGMGEVVRGLDEGVGGMVAGERRRLHVPSRCGYGGEGCPPKVPAHANLVFDVELVRC